MKNFLFLAWFLVHSNEANKVFIKEKSQYSLFNLSLNSLCYFDWCKLQSYAGSVMKWRGWNWLKMTLQNFQPILRKKRDDWGSIHHLEHFFVVETSRRFVNVLHLYSPRKRHLCTTLLWTGCFQTKHEYSPISRHQEIWVNSQALQKLRRHFSVHYSI